MARKAKKGHSVKRNKQTQSDEPEEIKRAPHSFVIYRGDVGHYIHNLTKDFRKVMEPFTASSLQVRKNNCIQDFVSVAGFLHVSHLVMFTRTERSAYMRICRLPRGPTLTFKIHGYSLSRDVLSHLKKQFAVSKEFKHAPLVVCNSFSGEGAQIKLMTSMFQNMFPPLNLTKINLDTVRRCVLFNYNPETKLIDFRHYSIRVVPVGLSRGVKKIVRSKVPNLGRFKDVSDFITKSEVLSDSEVEDDPNSHVTLHQKLSSRGNVASSQSAIRLGELGPRLSLQLIKVESGLLDGEVIFHELVHKSEKEKEKIRKQREEKRKLKEKRKKIQEMNIKKKKEIIKSNKGKDGFKEEVKYEDDDDAEWYREEVGEEPDTDLFANQSSGFKRKRSFQENRVRKKTKFSKNEDFRSSKGQSVNFKNKYPSKSNEHFKNRSSLNSKTNFKTNGTSKHKAKFNTNKRFNNKSMGSKVTRGQRHN